MSDGELEASATMLARILSETGASAPLLISDAEALGEQLKPHPGGHWLSGPEALPQTLERMSADLAIVDAAAALPPGNATALVSWLRDVHVQKVLVMARSDNAGELSRHSLIGLGFHRLAVSRDATGRRRWYEYDMAHYKVTPDWLNPRNWANPELWDKYRW